MNLYNKFSMLCYISPVWLTALLWFCFTVRNLYPYGPGVFFLFVILPFTVHTLTGQEFDFLFVILPFAVYTHASQEFDFFLCVMILSFTVFADAGQEYVSVFLFFPFAVYTHAGQEYVSVCDFVVCNLYSCRPGVCFLFL